MTLAASAVLAPVTEMFFEPSASLDAGASAIVIRLGSAMLSTAPTKLYEMTAPMAPPLVDTPTASAAE